MNLRQNYCLAALAVATMLMGLGCGQNHDREKPRVFLVQEGNVKVQEGNVKEVVTKGDLKKLMAGAPTPVNLSTVTINAGPAVGTCTSDNPAQELYTNTIDAGLNDQIRFKSSTNQSYTITFPNDLTPLTVGVNPVGTAGNPIIVPASPGFAGPFVVKFALDPRAAEPAGCQSSGNTCVFPYTINFNGGAQCNTPGSPNKGSNDIIVKCGPGC